MRPFGMRSEPPIMSESRIHSPYPHASIIMPDLCMVVSASLLLCVHLHCQIDVCSRLMVMWKPYKLLCGQLLPSNGQHGRMHTRYLRC